MTKLLIVDDSKSVHAFVKQLLSGVSEMSIEDCYDGSEALLKLHSSHPFDVILLDWEMPKLNGPDTLRTLRQKGIQTPIVMMTTKNALEDIQNMLQAGASEYLMKPFTIDILLEKLSFVTGRSFSNAA